MPSTSDNLVTIASFHSSAEAAIARNRLAEEGIDSRLGEEAKATWLWHWGAAAGGVKLFVHEYDAPLARHLLGILPDHLAGNDDNQADDQWEDDEDEDWVGEDWVGEDWADTDEDYDEPYSEDGDDPLSPERQLKRAWYASVVGILLLPPVLNCYSIWLIINHKLWKPQTNQTHTNWRFYASLAFNFVGLVCGALFWGSI